MSADLLEAFGAHSISKPAPEEPGHTKTLVPLASNGLRSRVPDITQDPLWRKDTSGTDVLFDAVDDVDDGDDFGDFEDPEPGSQKQQQQHSQHSQIATVNADSTNLLDLENLSVTVGRTATDSQIESTGAHNSDPFGSILGSEDTEISKTQQRRSASYDKQSEDDWGTFENAELITTDTKTRAEVPFQNVHSSEPLQGGIEDDSWAIFDNEPTTKQSRVVHPTVAQQSYTAPDDAEEDEWDAFEDGPGPESQTATKVLTSHPTDMIKPVPISTTRSTSSERHQRPTNVPPPSILLELLPKIYQNLATASRSASTSSNGDEIVTAAHRILRVFLTTARILAGRPHRWKRDPHLSQSMRISAAGSKGMKLQTIDRSHVVKEDQDAIEAITAWSRYAHAFNSTLLKAKIPRPTASANLSGNIPVRTANGPGVLTAKEVCAVCGLKRSERIVGIDTNVDDVFGEFWVEFWGHRDCCAFWEEAEGMLEQR